MSDLATRQLMHDLGKQLTRQSLGLGWGHEQLMDLVEANEFLFAEDQSVQAFLLNVADVKSRISYVESCMHRLGQHLLDRAREFCPTCKRETPLPAQTDEDEQ